MSAAIPVDAAVEASRAGRDPEAVLAAARQACEVRKRQQELRDNPPPIHGSARWSAPADLTSANLLRHREPDSGHGIHLGHIDDQCLYWAGESHLLTVAPTRTGKGTMQIIPNLLRYRGSAVVLDPKGELAEATATWRARNVGPVYLINPFDVPPFEGQTDAFNPLDHVRTENDATKLAEMIYPRLDDDRQKFFDNEAIGFLSAVIFFTARYAAPRDRTFATIRDTLATLGRDFFELLEAMRDPSMPPSIRNAAATVATKTREAGQPRPIDSLSQHLCVWDTPGLRKTTLRSDFDFRDLKEGPATVYLPCPSRKSAPIQPL